MTIDFNSIFSDSEFAENAKANFDDSFAPKSGSAYDHEVHEKILEALTESIRQEKELYNDTLEVINRRIDAQYANQPKVNPIDIFTDEEIRHYYNHSADFIEDKFVDENGENVVLDSWQREVCDSLDDPKRGFVSVAAGSGVGKSWLIPKLIYHHLAFRYNSKAPCTAPTEHQLFDVIWSGLRVDYDNNDWIRELFTWTQTKVFIKGYAATWYAVARTAVARKDGGIIEGLQGFHNKNMFAVLDEASGIVDGAMASVDGWLTEKGAKILMTSNPTRLSGRFYNSHHKSRMERGGPWYTIRVSCLDSAYVDPKYVAMMRREHGEDSSIYAVKVLGKFPSQEENALISSLDFDVALYGITKVRAEQGDIVIDRRKAEILTGVSDGSIDGDETSEYEHDILSETSDAMRRYSLSDIAKLNPQLAPAYNSVLFANRSEEDAIYAFANRIGFRGDMLSGSGGYSRPLLPILALPNPGMTSSSRQRHEQTANRNRVTA